MRRSIPILLVLAGLVFAEEWWVILPRGRAAVEVRADGQASKSRSSVPRHPHRRLSPDGTRWVHIVRKRVDWGLYVGEVGTGKAMQFTKLLAMGSQAAWSPDVKVLYTTKDGSTWQVRRMNPDGTGNSLVRSLPAKSRRPEISPDGTRVAYHVEGKAWGKSTADDFFVMDLKTGATMRLVEKRYIADHAWSHDGQRIAVSSDGRLFLFHAAGKLLRKVEYDAIDERLYAHAAHHLLWRPDGNEVACQISFLGGRIVIEGEETTPIYGDHELFLVPVEGEVRVQTLPRDVWVKPIAWSKKKSS